MSKHAGYTKHIGSFHIIWVLDPYLDTFYECHHATFTGVAMLIVCE